MLALGLTNTKICSNDDSPVFNLFLRKYRGCLICLKVIRHIICTAETVMNRL